MTEQIDFEAFRASWLQSVQEGTPSTVELGRRFALKLITQWLDASEATADLVYCDGSGDGGIDVAFLDEGPDTTSDAPEESGHAWYLVQSKYGSAFAGIGTLLIEGQKVIETLDGRRQRLNSLAEGLLERLANFRNAAGPSDRLVLVFATERGLDEAEKRALNDLRVLGRDRLGPIFDVEAISIETIHAPAGRGERRRGAADPVARRQFGRVGRRPARRVGAAGQPVRFPAPLPRGDGRPRPDLRKERPSLSRRPRPGEPRHAEDVARGARAVRPVQ